MHKIDRFGVEAILGRRQLYFGEMRRMVYAENILVAYRSRAQSQDWAEWLKANPVLGDMLAEAEAIAEGVK